MILGESRILGIGAETLLLPKSNLLKIRCFLMALNVLRTTRREDTNDAIRPSGSYFLLSHIRFRLWTDRGSYGLLPHNSFRLLHRQWHSGRNNRCGRHVIRDGEERQ